MASREIRAAAVDRLAQRFPESEAALGREDAAAVLLTAGGTWQQDAARRLFSQRDNRQIHLLE
jgi:hypothetical protein